MATILDLSAWALSDQGQIGFANLNNNFDQQLDNWYKSNPGHSIKVVIYEEKGYLHARATGNNEVHLRQINALIDEYFYPYKINEGDASPFR